MDREDAETLRIHRTVTRLRSIFTAFEQVSVNYDGQACCSPLTDLDVESISEVQT